MTTTELIEKIESNNKLISRLVVENNEMSKKLKTSSVNDWDWVSVKDASNITQLSQTTLYNYVNKGVLTVKRIGSKILLKGSEIQELGDTIKATI